MPLSIFATGLSFQVIAIFTFAYLKEAHYAKCAIVILQSQGRKWKTYEETSGTLGAD